MKLERMIGARIKSLSNLLKRQVDQSMSEIGIEPLTGMQGRIVGYLGHHQDQDVFQRDIEEEFQIRRSTATGILKLMEKNGMIGKESVPEDARLKRLKVTARGMEYAERMQQGILKMEEQLISGLTDEEVRLFESILAKISQNIGC